MDTSKRGRCYCFNAGCISLLRPYVAPEGLETLAMLDQSSNHLLVLLNDMLDVAKIDHGQLQLEKAEVFMDAEVEHVMSIVRPTIRDRDIQLHPEVTEAVPRCVCGCRLPHLSATTTGPFPKFTSSICIVPLE